MCQEEEKYGITLWRPRSDLFAAAFVPTRMSANYLLSKTQRRAVPRMEGWLPLNIIGDARRSDVERDYSRLGDEQGAMRGRH